MRALHQRRFRQSEGRFIAEGIRVVEDLLSSPVQALWGVASSSIEDTPRGHELIARLGRKGVEVRRTEDAEITEFAGTDSPQGVLLVARIPHHTLADILPRAGERSVVLAMDGVQDPGNFGTMVRSAEALGATAVVALPGTVDPWNAKSVRSAAGSSFRVPIVECSWSELSDWSRSESYRLLAATVDGGPLPQNLDRAVLIVGNEGAGISAEVMGGVDVKVGIPLRGRAESLNVAAAAAILLYELTR